MLALLRAHSVPWDGDTTDAAAAGGGGGMSALTYAYDYGCPLGDEVCFCAAWAGDIAMLE
jgi:hypothetical protein